MGDCDADGPTRPWLVAVVSAFADGSCLPLFRIRHQSLAIWPGRAQFKQTLELLFLPLPVFLSPDVLVSPLALGFEDSVQDESHEKFH